MLPVGKQYVPRSGGAQYPSRPTYTKTPVAPRLPTLATTAFASSAGRANFSGVRTSQPQISMPHFFAPRDGTGGDQPPPSSMGGGPGSLYPDLSTSGTGTTDDAAAATETPAASPFEALIATWSKGWRAVAVLLVVALIVLYLLKR